MQQVLNSLNRTILNILQECNNITNADLAKRVNLSPVACLERVKKLEEAGIIKERTAILDLEKIGKGVTVLASLSMNDHSSIAIKNFWEQIQNIPEIQECYHTAGDIWLCD